MKEKQSDCTEILEKNEENIQKYPSDKCCFTVMKSKIKEAKHEEKITSTAFERLEDMFARMGFSNDENPFRCKNRKYVFKKSS